MCVAVWSEEQSRRVKSKNCRYWMSRVVTGMDGLIEMATLEEAEILVTAIVGMIGIRPTIAAITGRKRYCACQQRDDW